MTDWCERERAAANGDAELLELREEVDLLRAFVCVMRGALNAVETGP